MGLQEDHTASGHGGGRGEGQVIDFEHHGHDVGKLDDSSRVEAELLVIVEDSVHVLNPDSVDWSIEHDPLPVRTGAFSVVTHNNSQHSVSPFVGGVIEVTIELVLPDTLGVHDFHLDLEVVLLVGDLLLDAGHGVFEDLDGSTLTSEGLSNHHESMSNLDHVKQLQGLLDE